MADIQMRFGKDMLVLSTSFNHSFAQLGFDLATEEAYVDLCEPETVEQAYQMEKMIGTPCFCTATECITNARLAHEKFEGHGKDIAAFAWESVHAFSPEHALAVIGPSGLPLDESSATSLKASRAQYQTAVKELTEYPFDALFFSGFTSAYDAQCALMGARAVYDGPVFLSYALTDAGELPTHTHTLAEAVALADEYGADVIGIASGATYEHLAPAIEILRENTTKPLLAELVVRELIERAYDPDLDNPYACRGSGNVRVYRWAGRYLSRSRCGRIRRASVWQNSRRAPISACCKISSIACSPMPKSKRVSISWCRLNRSI